MCIFAYRYDTGGDLEQVLLRVGQIRVIYFGSYFMFVCGIDISKILDPYSLVSICSFGLGGVSYPELEIGKPMGDNRLAILDGRFLDYLYLNFRSKGGAMGKQVLGAMLFNLLGGLAYITAWINSVEWWKHLILFFIGVLFLLIKIRIYYISMQIKHMEFRERRAQAEYNMRKLLGEEKDNNLGQNK